MEIQTTTSSFKMINKIKDKIERKRLEGLPRYTPGFTTLLGKRIEFVDVCTYMLGLEHIFGKEIYNFTSLNKRPLIIDCGSNIGLSILYFKKIYPDARVIGFEPDPAIFKALVHNVESFHCKHVELHNQAVWITNGSIDFQIEGGFSGRIPKYGDTSRIVTTPCVRLNDYLNNEIDFLKIDIEGAEYKVILDCRNQLKYVKNIFIEYHSHISEEQNLHELLQILTEAGFRYHLHEAFTRPRPFIDSNLMLGMDLQLDVFGTR